MKAFLEHRWTLFILRLLLGGAFLYAGTMKIASPEAFADSIFTFQLLPDSLVNMVAMALPLFEMMVGGMLVLGLELRVASFSAIFLTAGFALALGQALARGLEVDCGCFGRGKPSPWKTWGSLGRDLLFFAAAVLVYRKERSGALKVDTEFGAEQRDAPEAW
jgi:uncharacterized membrane protein YphA (DoxX/SURF4 family)